MPSTEAPTWWADVQQERDDLAADPGRRPAEDWLGEDVDFVPRRRITRGAARTIELVGDVGSARGDLVVGRPSREDLVVARPADVTRELRGLARSDDPFAAPPPPDGARRTVAITGRPAVYRVPTVAQRHRGRTANDRVGHRPDRIALWAVVLGAILILVAAASSVSQAATVRRVAAPHARAAAHVAAPHARPAAHVAAPHARRALTASATQLRITAARR